LLMLRILSALIGIPIILLAMWLGKTSFAVVISLVVILGALEFSDFVKKKGIVHGRGKVIASAFVFPLLAFFDLFPLYSH
jgi:CDP-diglyceride synthetase